MAQRQATRISTSVNVGGDNFTIEYFSGVGILGREVEYVDISNGGQYDDFRGLFLDNLDEAKKFHEALGGIIASAEYARKKD